MKTTYQAYRLTDDIENLNFDEGENGWRHRKTFEIGSVFVIEKREGHVDQLHLIMKTEKKALPYSTWNKDLIDLIIEKSEKIEGEEFELFKFFVVAKGNCGTGFVKFLIEKTDSSYKDLNSLYQEYISRD